MYEKTRHVIFRVDASDIIGTGHVMRCLTLASEFCQRKIEVLFILRELPGNLCGFVGEKGYRVKVLPHIPAKLNMDNDRPPHAEWIDVDWATDAKQTKEILINERMSVDWLVVDHYALDSRWENYMRPFVKKIMAIDDLADRTHDCDLILDQNYYKNMEWRYEGLVPGRCKRLLGPKFVLLRHEFIEARKNLRERDGKLRRIIIFFGGFDRTHETEKVLKALKLLNMENIEVDVIASSMNGNKDVIKNMCRYIPRISYYCQVDNMAELMSGVDISIGAGGTTTWERCCLGLPSLVITTANNQIQPIKELAANNVIYYIGKSEEITQHDILNALQSFFCNPDILKQYSKNSMELVDGFGTQRCVNEML